MDIKNTCLRLCSAVGVSGNEQSAAEVARELLSAYMPAHIDPLGNVCGTIGQGETHLLLDAHIDQIGLIVRSIDKNGFILFDKCGGADPRVLTGCEVTVHGKKPLFGVVCSVPPHLTSGDKSSSVDIKKLAVDIGYSKKEGEKLVSLGDRITLRTGFVELQNGLLSSGALDDRSSVCAVLLALEKLKGQKLPCKLSVLFSTREETTGSGAATGSFSAEPHEAIAVDVGFGTQPGVGSEEGIALSKGPSIGISPTLDRGMEQRLVSLAKKHSIPYQHDIMPSRTGTNCDSISVSRGGVRCALLSLPLRNMHTGVEVIDPRDIEYTAELICKYILEGGNRNA